MQYLCEFIVLCIGVALLAVGSANYQNGGWPQLDGYIAGLFVGWAALLGIHFLIKTVTD